MERIYLSGKVTGLNYHYAYRRFLSAEERLTQLGYTVVNPMKLCHRKWPWLRCMAVCLWHLLFCTDVFMLDNHKYSRGAKIELWLALKLKKNIIFQRY